MAAAQIPGTGTCCCGTSPPTSPCRTPYCSGTDRCVSLDLSDLNDALDLTGAVIVCGGLPDTVLLNYQVCQSSGSVTWEVHDGAGNRSVTLCDENTAPGAGAPFDCPTVTIPSIPTTPCQPGSYPNPEGASYRASADCFEYGTPVAGAVTATVSMASRRVVSSGYRQEWILVKPTFGVQGFVYEAGGWLVLYEDTTLTVLTSAYATPGSPVTVTVAWTLTVTRFLMPYLIRAAGSLSPHTASYAWQSAEPLPRSPGSTATWLAANQPSFTPDTTTSTPSLETRSLDSGPLATSGEPTSGTTTYSGTTTITLTAGQPCTGGGFMARPAMTATGPAHCRFRSGEEDTDRGALARDGLPPVLTWHRCEKPGFARLGLPVTECRTCGVPADRKCGSLDVCPGYEPDTGAEP
jgi:hypothetical protein